MMGGKKEGRKEEVHSRKVLEIELELELELEPELELVLGLELKAASVESRA